MIEALAISFILVIAFSGYKEVLEHECEKAWVQVDKCKVNYSLESCKSIYLPPRCDDGVTDDE